MPYLNLDLDYFDHPKTLRLKALAGDGSDIFPLKLWVFCGKYHPGDGKLSGYSDIEIEKIVGWKGDSGLLTRTMVKVGFILRIRNGYKVKDWNEHSGHLSIFKSRAKTAAKARWGKYATSNAKETDKQSYKQCPIPNSTNLSKPTKPTKPIKKIYGEFRNVKLTDDEYEKLKNRIGEKMTEEIITDLDSGIESKGYKYKSHYATILNWSKKRNPIKNQELRGLDALKEI